MLDIIYGIIFEPASALRKASEAKIYSLAVGSLILAMFFNMVVSLAGVAITPNHSGYYPMTVKPVVISALGMAIAVLFGCFILSALFSLVSEIFYHKSNAGGLFAALSYTFIPALLGSSLQYLMLLWGGIAASGVLTIVFTGWIIVLQLLALREALDLNMFQALTLYLSPLVFLVILFILSVGFILLI